MIVKVKESFEKTGHVKNNDKSKKYILRGEGNVIFDIVYLHLYEYYKLLH